MRNAIFAVRGRNVNPDSFNWKTFNANVHELKQTMLAIQEGFKAFIFWEARGIRLLGNVAALFLFQFMISFPTETIALLPMAVLIGLQLEYWSLTDPSPIATRLTAVQMFITLLCGLAPSGLIAHPPATQEKSSDGGQNEEGRASEEEEDSEEEDSSSRRRFLFAIFVVLFLLCCWCHFRVSSSRSSKERVLTHRVVREKSRFMPVFCVVYARE